MTIHAKPFSCIMTRSAASCNFLKHRDVLVAGLPLSTQGKGFEYLGNSEFAMADTMLSEVVEQAKKAAKQQDRRPLTAKEIETAWSVLCPTGITMTNTEAENLLTMLYPEKLGAKQLRYLIPAEGVTREWLQQLLVDQPPGIAQTFDACEQAFCILDPGKTGAVDIPTLTKLMQQIHHVELNEREMSMLMQLADADMDGKISVDDFRKLFDRQQQAAAGATVRQKTIARQAAPPLSSPEDHRSQ